MDIDILGVRYPVEFADEVFTECGHIVYARCENQPPCIRISKAVAPSQRMYILVHEVVHALSYMGHLQFVRRVDDPHTDDEASVDALASLITEVISRNKEVFLPLLTTGGYYK